MRVPGWAGGRAAVTATPGGRPLRAHYCRPLPSRDPPCTLYSTCRPGTRQGMHALPSLRTAEESCWPEILKRVHTRLIEACRRQLRLILGPPRLSARTASHRLRSSNGQSIMASQKFPRTCDRRLFRPVCMACDYFAINVTSTRRVREKMEFFAFPLVSTSLSTRAPARNNQN